MFEGIDGSGKGTMIRAATSFLLENGFPEERLLLTAEPTNGFYGKKVRELLATTPEPGLNAPQFLDLYVCDRKEHLEKSIIPALKKGQIVLCDRYKYSTFVYQCLQGVPIEKIKELHKGMLVPGLVVILDVPADVSLERISRRKRLETFEQKDFLEKVRRGFLELKKVFPEENIVVVDASKPKEVVAKEVCRIVSGLVKK